MYSRIQVSGTFQRRANSAESIISQREIGVVSSAFGIILILLSNFVLMPLSVAVSVELSRHRPCNAWPCPAECKTTGHHSGDSGGVAEKPEGGAFVSASFVGFLSRGSRLFKSHHSGEESEPHKTSGAVALLGYVQDFCPRHGLTKFYVALI